MTPADIDRVFGRGRLRMLTGEHVEVFREASLPGERRRYTKRFLATEAGDFRHWTEREWRILARLVGHGIGPVPDVVQFDRGAADRPALVQTYDAGVTVDHWATLLPVERDGVPLRHVFEDCAHWWALAHHCLVALDAIHALQLVHLDLKADNVCIPFGPADFDPQSQEQHLSPCFAQIALIDFAFSLVSGEALTRALPIARQTEYDYQSPRLLHALEAGGWGDLAPTRQLDWRCDVFSLAAMLRRYLPDPELAIAGDWTRARDTQARALVRRLLQAHDCEEPGQRPHAELLALTANALAEPELAMSLAQGWRLAIGSEVLSGDGPTPVTRIAQPVSVESPSLNPAITRLDAARQGRQRARRWAWSAAAASVAAIGAPLFYAAWSGSPRGELPAVVVAALAPPAAAPERAPALDPVPEPAPAPLSQAAAVAAPAWPAPAPVPPPADQAAPDAAAPAAAAAPTPAAPVTVAATPPPTPAEAVPSSVPAAAMKARRAGLAKSSARAAVTRATAPAAPPLSDRARALAWLTQRGPSPRGAARPFANAWPAVALAPAPATPALPPKTAAAVPVPSTPPAAIVMAPALVLPPVAVAEHAPAPRAIERTAPQARDFAARASLLMATELPQLAQRAERRVLRVMSLAAQSDQAWQKEDVRRAASAVPDPDDEPLADVGLAAADARALHQAARAAFWNRGSAREALELQTKAFGANPVDADIVGALAFLSLKQGPSQAEPARQLALYALSLDDVSGPAGRVQDWTTLAIASALTGRERDARNAWFVTLALAPQPERQCRAAINAYSLHGERLRASVEAMLYRAHAFDRAQGSAFCEWPPHWTASREPR